MHEYCIYSCTLCVTSCRKIFCKKFGNVKNIAVRADAEPAPVVSRSGYFVQSNSAGFNPAAARAS